MGSITMDTKQKKTILLAEDDGPTAFLIEQKLQNAGYEVLLVKDGEAALTALKGSVPDLVLLDIDMPHKSGLEVLREMRGALGLGDLPVIVISNSGSPIEVYNFQKLGVKDYLIKVDFDPDELLMLIRKYL